jgi:ATP-dependent Lon protease
VILPEENRETLSDFPEDILKDMQIDFVSDVADVIKLVIMPADKPKAKAAAK